MMQRNQSAHTAWEILVGKTLPSCQSKRNFEFSSPKEDENMATFASLRGLHYVKSYNYYNFLRKLDKEAKLGSF